VTEPGAGADPGPAAPEPAATCPWCAAPAAVGATRCSAGGAALAQRESIGDLRIPGLTSVDPALEDFDKRPLHLRGPSPSQGVAPALIIGAVAGGPIGLMAIGGVAAVAGAEFLGTRIGGSHGAPALEDVGKPSEVVLKALERGDADPKPPITDDAEASEADDGRSIWRDLPSEPDEGT
jgi:hypothetical protein